MAVKPTVREKPKPQTPEPLLAEEAVYSEQLQSVDDLAWSGERRLLLALLEDAVKLVLGCTVARAAEIHEARWWIAYRGRGPTTFDSCCVAAGVDPDAIREGIEKAIERRVVLPPRFWRHQVGTAVDRRPLGKSRVARFMRAR